MTLQIYHNKNHAALVKQKLKEQLDIALSPFPELESEVASRITKINDIVTQKIIDGEERIKRDKNAETIVKKIKGKLKRQEIEEKILFLTMHQNALTKKDFEQKMKLIRDNKQMFEEYYDQERLLYEKLGIVQHLKEVSTYHERAANTDDFMDKKNFKHAQTFIKRIANEREERERQKREKEQQLKEKADKDQEETNRRREEERVNQEEEHKKKRQDIYQTMKQKEEERKKFRDETAVAVKEVMKAKPKYMVIEQKYKEEIELPDLEQQKKKLQDLRNLYQPVHNLKIDRHQKNYDIQKKQMENEIKHQRDLSQRNIREHVANLKYKPHISDMDDFKLQSQIDEQEKIKEEKKRIADKVGNYAKYVKEMYWPKVSESKRQELAGIKEHIKTSPVRRSNSFKKIPGKKHPPSLQDQHERYDDHNMYHSGSTPSLPSNYSPHQYQVKRKKVDWGNSLQTTKNNQQKQNLDMIKSVDYLKDQRNKREVEGRPKLYDDKVWDKYLKDQTMSEYQRLDEIRKRALIMEERAKMDEKLIRNNQTQNHRDNVEKSIAVNDLYLEAIQAKLKILDQI